MSNKPFTPMHIGGQDRRSSTGATFEVRNPATKELVSVVAAASAADWCVYPYFSPLFTIYTYKGYALNSKEAVETAGKAFESWSQTTPGFRAAIFRKAAELIATPEFNQKIVKYNVEEVGLTAQWGAFIDATVSKMALVTAGEMPYKIKGEVLPSDLGNQAFVIKKPMGVM